MLSLLFHRFLSVAKPCRSMNGKFTSEAEELGKNREKNAIFKAKTCAGRNTVIKHM